MTSARTYDPYTATLTAEAKKIGTSTVLFQTANVTYVGSRMTGYQDTTTGATNARNADYTLPTSSLFRLVAGSDLIDRGLNVGLPFAGSAPDRRMSARSWASCTFAAGPSMQMASSTTVARVYSPSRSSTPSGSAPSTR